MERESVEDGGAGACGLGGDDGAERPFESFGQFGPGSLDVRCFDQGRWWVNRDGLAFEIASEMTVEYLDNVIRFLTEDADYFHGAVVKSCAIELLARLEAEDARQVPAAAQDLRQVWEQSASDWLAGTPLMNALAARRSELATRSP